jgi:hypothetical protein
LLALEVVKLCGEVVSHRNGVNVASDNHSGGKVLIGSRDNGIAVARNFEVWQGFEGCLNLIFKLLFVDRDRLDVAEDKCQFNYLSV